MDTKKLVELFEKRFVAHPWHGVTIGDDMPNTIKAYIEILPKDTLKYEVDKDSGLIFIDRPQKYSNNMPAMYGFVPQTYCAEEVAEYCNSKTGKSVEGDGDPLDILVLTERHVEHSNILMDVVPIGGFRMIDGGEADDKIIAVLAGDKTFEQYKDVAELPEMMVKRLKHYFLTYKDVPGEGDKAEIEITHTYGKDEALEVVRRSYRDYINHYGNVKEDFVAELDRLIKE